MPVPIPSLDFGSSALAQGGTAGTGPFGSGGPIGSSGHGGIIFNQAGTGAKLTASQGTGSSSVPWWVWALAAGSLLLWFLFKRKG